MSSLVLGGLKMIDQFINFVIRPPRAEYDPDQYLWEKDFSIGGTKCKRQDLEDLMFFSEVAYKFKGSHLALQSLHSFIFFGEYYYSSSLCYILPW